MPTRIKVCGMTLEKDVALCCELGVDAIGMVFYPKSPRFLQLEKAKKLITIAKPFMTTVAVVVNPSRNELEQIIRETRVDIIQFHGEENAQYCESFDRPYYKALRVRPNMTKIDLHFVFQQYSSSSGLLLDTYDANAYGGTGKTFNWDILRNTTSLQTDSNRFEEKINKKIIVAGGLSIDNVSHVVEKVSPYSVDVSSGVEIQPGIKNAKKLVNFVNLVNKVDLAKQ